MIVYCDTSFLVSYLNEEDLWHLGAAWSLSAGAFLTFDSRQKTIAKLLGMA